MNLVVVRREKNPCTFGLLRLLLLRLLQEVYVMRGGYVSDERVYVRLEVISVIRGCICDERIYM